jgi:hypothetical protein
MQSILVMQSVDTNSEGKISEIKFMSLLLSSGAVTHD